MSRGVYYAVASEINIPKNLTATTIGIAAILGFSPDLFQYMMYGHWIYTYGVTVYKFMFIYQIVVVIVALIPCTFVIRNKKRNNKNEK